MNRHLVALAFIIISVFNLNCGKNPLDNKLKGELGKPAEIGQEIVTVEEAVLAKSIVKCQPMALLQGAYKNSEILSEKFYELKHLGVFDWNKKPGSIFPNKGDGFIILHIKVKDNSTLGQERRSELDLFAPKITDNEQLKLETSGQGNGFLSQILSNWYIYNFDERISTLNGLSNSEYEVYRPFEISTSILQKELYLKLSDKITIKLKEKGLSQTDNLYNNTVFKTVNW